MDIEGYRVVFVRGYLLDEFHDSPAIDSFKEFQTFVSNRVGEIHLYRSSSQWRHVPGKLNVLKG